MNQWLEMRYCRLYCTAFVKEIFLVLAIEWRVRHHSCHRPIAISKRKVGGGTETVPPTGATICFFNLVLGLGALMKYLVAVLKSLRGVNSQRILAIANSYDWYLPVTHPRRPAWTSRTHCLFINPISFFFRTALESCTIDTHDFISSTPLRLVFFPRSFSWFICRYFITRVTKVFFSNIGVFLSLIQSILVFSF